MSKKQHRKTALAQFGSMYGADMTKDIKKAMEYEGEKLPVYPNQKGREAQPGACYSPDGVDDFVTSPAIYASTHPTTQNNWGFCMWAKFDNSVTTAQCYFKKGTGVASNTGGFCQTTNGGSGPNFRFWVTSNYLTYAEHGIGWNEWLHLAYIMKDDNGTLKTQIYINGVFAKEENIHADFLVFNAMLGGYTGRVPSGLFYDWRMFEGELTQSDIQNAMKGLITNKEVVWWGCNERDGTKAIDLSGNNYHGTITNATISTFHAIDNEVKYNIANLYGYVGDKATINECIATALANGDSDTSTNWWGASITAGTNFLRTFDFDTKISRLETTAIADNVNNTISFGAFARPISYWQGTSVTYIWSFEYRGNVDFRRGGAGVDYGILTATENWQKHTLEIIITSVNASYTQLNFYMFEGGTYINQPNGSWLEIRNLEYKAKTYIHPISPKSGVPIRFHFYTPAQQYTNKNEFSWRNTWFKGAAPFNPKLVESHCLTLNGTDQAMPASATGQASTFDFNPPNFDRTEHIFIVKIDVNTNSAWTWGATATIYPCYASDNKIYWKPYNLFPYWDKIDINIEGDGLYHEFKVVTECITGNFSSPNTDISCSLYLDGVLLRQFLPGDSLYSPTVPMGTITGITSLGNGTLSLGCNYVLAQASKGYKSNYENSKWVVDDFRFSEGAGDKIYNAGLRGGYFVITNFTESCWANTQDKFHWNALKGFNDGSAILVKNDFTIDIGTFYAQYGNWDVSHDAVNSYLVYENNTGGVISDRVNFNIGSILINYPKWKFKYRANFNQASMGIIRWNGAGHNNLVVPGPIVSGEWNVVDLEYIGIYTGGGPSSLYFWEFTMPIGGKIEIEYYEAYHKWGLKIPAKVNNPYQDALGNAITPKFGRKWNSPESKLKLNPNNAPELIQAGFDDTNLEDFVEPLPSGLTKTDNNEYLI